MLFANPALEAFVRSLGPGKVWGQVLIRATGNEFILRHAEDGGLDIAQLNAVTLADVRKLATFASSGQFRPLRSAPDLARGWVFRCQGADQLGRAIQEFYPGSMADWWAAQRAEPPITNYREYTARQSGMYRITQLLTDEQAGEVARATCHARFCLKQRWWTVNGLAQDSASEKSEIPCLEPCAVLLEMARKTARVEQEEKLNVQLSRSELDSFLAGAEAALASGLPGERTGDIGSALNPRRLQLLLEKFKKPKVPAAEKSDG